MWNIKKFLRSSPALLSVLLLFGHGSSEAAYVVNATTGTPILWGVCYYDAEGTFVRGIPRTMQANSYEAMPGMPSGASGLYFLMTAYTLSDYNAGSFRSSVGVGPDDAAVSNLYVRLSEGHSEKWTGRLEHRNESVNSAYTTLRSNGNFLSYGSQKSLEPGAVFLERPVLYSSTTIGIGSQPYVPNSTSTEFFWVPTPLDGLIQGTYILTTSDGLSWRQSYSLSGEGGVAGGGTGGTTGGGAGGTTTTNVVNVDLGPVTAGLASVTSAVGSVATGISSVVSAVLGLGTSISGLITDVQNAYAGLAAILVEIRDTVSAGFSKVVGFVDWVTGLATFSNDWLTSYQASLFQIRQDNGIALADYQLQWQTYFDEAISDPALGDPATYASASMSSYPHPLNREFRAEGVSGLGIWDEVANLLMNTLRGVNDMVIDFGGWVMRGVEFVQNYSFGTLDAMAADLYRQAATSPDPQMLSFLNSICSQGRGDIRDAITSFLGNSHFVAFKTFLKTDSVQITQITLVRDDWVMKMPVQGGSKTYNKGVGGAAGAVREISLFPGDHPKIDKMIKFLRCLMAFGVYLLIVWAAWKHFNVEVEKVQGAQLRAAPAGQSILGNNVNWKAVLVNAAFYVAIVLAFITAYATMFVLFDVDCCNFTEVMGLLNVSKEAKMAVGMANYVIPMDCIFTALTGYVFFNFAWLPVSTFWITALRVAHV